jgi:hypothetical protein
MMVTHLQLARRNSIPTLKTLVDAQKYLATVLRSAVHALLGSGT